MAAPRIRPAGPDHLATLLALDRAVFAEDAIPIPDALAENLGAMRADPDALIVRLGDGPQPLGHASATLTRGAEFGLAAELEDLSVVPEARGRGYAARRLSAAVAWAESRGARVISLVNTPEAEQGLAAFSARFGVAPSGRALLNRTTTAEPGR